MDNIKILDVNTVNENQLPTIISSQFSALTELENNVQKAVNMAAQAKRKAVNAQVSAGLFHKKEAIELLQNATKGLAEAQITAADAQKISFEYQSKLTEITKFLFGLGVSNLAMNRSVIRELELKLKGASDEEISELAKQELRNVIMQLKLQEDMMQKQKKIAEDVGEQHRHINKLNKQIDSLEVQDQKQKERLAENTDTIEEHEKVLFEQRRKDEEHDRKFAEQDKEDEAQDEKIAQNAKMLSEHSITLEQHHIKDTEIEKRTQKNSEKILSVKDDVDKRFTILDEKLQDVNSVLKENLMSTNSSISNLSNLLEDEKHEIREVIYALKEDFQVDIDNISKEYEQKRLDLNKYVNDKNEEVNSKINELNYKTDNLRYIISKVGWKIGVSSVALLSLLINILQIMGVI